MTELEDGNYDVMIIEASEDEENVMHLELTLTSGARRGEVVRVAARGESRACTDLLGLPARLIISDGAPRVEFI